MKHLPVFILCLVTLFIAACGGEPTETPRPVAVTGDRHQADDGDEPIDKAPRLGMSKRQIEKMYGEADDIRHSSRGEVWNYWFNKGGMFIPYNFGYKPRHGTFTFNANGTLIDFDYNE